MDILPIVIGWDLGEYGFVRLAHETIGVRSVVVTPYARGPINHSQFIDLRLVGKNALSREDSFLAELSAIEKDYPDKKLLLIVNADEHVTFIVNQREGLSDRWILPYASTAAINMANSKERVGQVFHKLGLHTPQSIFLDLHHPAGWDAELAKVRFPVVLKPEVRSELNINWSAGLRKALPQDAPEQVKATLQSWHDAGVYTSIAVQELIPGDDTTQWMVNGYVDSYGNCTAIGSARVLLGMHTPNLIGNAAIALVKEDPHLIEDAIRIVSAIGLRGFFSLDVKLDSRDGTPYWLDVNPRLGRNHYYLKAGGVNVLQALLNDVNARTAPQQRITQEAIYHNVPIRLMNKNYIDDSELLAHVRKVAKSHRVHPLRYRAERDPRRYAYTVVNGENLARQMKKTYPTRTDSGF